MRKYLMNGAIIGSMTSAFGLLKTSKDASRIDWRIILLWASWAVGLALAIGAVAEDARQERTDS